MLWWQYPLSEAQRARVGTSAGKVHIGPLELLSVLISVEIELEGDHERELHLDLCTDSMSSHFNVNDMRARRDPDAAWLTMALSERLMVGAHTAASTHVPGVENVLSDGISRLAAEQANRLLRMYFPHAQIVRKPVPAAALAHIKRLVGN